MNIIVLLSRTFDSEQQITVQDNKVQIVDVNYMINPLDERALEEAIRLKEKHGGTVLVVTAGEENAEKQLRLALAIGADKGVLLLLDDAKEEPVVIANALSSYLQTVPFDIILAGAFAMDGGSGQVGPRVAAALNIPYITNIAKLTIENGKAIVEKDTGEEVATYGGPLPLLVTVPQGLNEPRLPALAGIMKAKRKPLDKITPQLNNSLSITTEQYQFPIVERQNVFIQGDSEKQAGQLSEIIKKMR
ncbi:electron transfer flavoprotein subunit beta/FixA family protein [Niallia sp. 03190]|uniref:electron transfer flavoprotein subunit beta/FixA family protein n=1 Tax=Niallia sp. 03190 TaxID=3458061 RepID=UPI00404453AE